MIIFGCDLAIILVWAFLLLFGAFSLWQRVGFCWMALTESSGLIMAVVL